MIDLAGVYQQEAVGLQKHSGIGPGGTAAFPGAAPRRLSLSNKELPDLKSPSGSHHSILFPYSSALYGPNSQQTNLTAVAIAPTHPCSAVSGIQGGCISSNIPNRARALQVINPEDLTGNMKRNQHRNHLKPCQTMNLQDPHFTRARVATTTMALFGTQENDDDVTVPDITFRHSVNRQQRGGALNAGTSLSLDILRSSPEPRLASGHMGRQHTVGAIDIGKSVPPHSSHNRGAGVHAPRRHSSDGPDTCNEEDFADTIHHCRRYSSNSLETALCMRTTSDPTARMLHGKHTSDGVITNSSVSRFPSLSHESRENKGGARTCSATRLPRCAGTTARMYDASPFLTQDEVNQKTSAECEAQVQSLRGMPFIGCINLGGDA